MKIIAVDNNYGSRSAQWEEPTWYLLTHSCLHRDNKPLYVPTWDSDFKLFPSMALRIDRLGKSIPARFAHRYWNSWSFGFSMRGMSTFNKLREAGLPVGSAYAFDTGAIIAPQCVEIGDESLDDISFQISNGTEELATWNYSSLLLKTDELIEVLSLYMTFKTGDILYLGFPEEGISLSADMKIIVNRSFKRGTDTIFHPFSGFNIRTYPQKGH